MLQGGSVFLLDSNNPLWAATRKSSRAKDPQKPGATLNVALFQRFQPHNNKFLSTNRPKMEPHSKAMRVRSDTFCNPFFQKVLQNQPPQLQVKSDTLHSFAVLSKIGLDFSKIVEVAKKSFCKYVLLNSYFSLKKIFRKIRMTFDIRKKSI